MNNSNTFPEQARIPDAIQIDEKTWLIPAAQEDFDAAFPGGERNSEKRLDKSESDPLYSYQTRGNDPSE